MQAVRRVAVAIMVAMAAMLTLCAPQAALAQQARLWVASNGNDANPCTRAAPCASFQAVFQTYQNTPGFEVDCVDSGDYGVLYIYVPATIDCAGTNARFAGIAIQTPPTGGLTGDVILRNVVVDCTGTGNDGVFVGHNAPHTYNVTLVGVSIRHCANGVHAAFGSARITLVDSVVADNAQHGAYVEASGTGPLAATDSAFATNGLTGVRIDAGTAMLTNVSLLGNGTHGTAAVSTGASVRIFLKNVTSSGNANGGVLANGPAAAVYLSNTILSGNNYGMYPPIGGGAYISFGNNQAAGNTTSDGSPTSTKGQF